MVAPDTLRKVREGRETVSGADYALALLNRARERTAAEGPGGAAHGTVRVLIVDAHEIMRAGLVRLLSSTDGIEVVGEAAAGEAAVALAATVQPDVVLLDFILPDIDGVEVARRLLAASHPVQIVMLTSISDERRVREAIEVGVIGYLLNDIGRAELVEAIVQAADGRPTLHPTARNYLLRSVSPPPAPSSSPALSKRDREIMRFLALGYSNRGIAGTLGLTYGTVKVYVSALLDKLGVSDRIQAALIAERYGLDMLEDGALPRPSGH